MAAAASLGQSEELGCRDQGPILSLDATNMRNWICIPLLRQRSLEFVTRSEHAPMRPPHLLKYIIHGSLVCPRIIVDLRPYTKLGRFYSEHPASIYLAESSQQLYI